MTHDDLVLHSADLYRSHLQKLLSGASTPIAVRNLASSLDSTYAAAISKRVHTQASDIRFSASSFMPLNGDERRELINPASLGVGNPDARTIFLGAEHAYSPENDADLPSLASEGAGLTSLWLSGDRSDLACQMRGHAASKQRSFHRHPTDYYKAEEGHTWSKIAKIMQAPGAHKASTTPGLGDVCYLIEISHQSSRTSSFHRPPTGDRIDFVALVLETLKPVCKNLVIHGSRHAVTDCARAELAGRFLGRRYSPTDHSRPHHPLQVDTHQGHRVIRTRALSSAVDDPYLRQVASLLL